MEPVSDMEEVQPPLVIETPTPRVQKDAKFYPMMGGTLDGHLSYRKIGDATYFPPIGDASWHPTNAKRFRDVAIPAVMSAHWRHKVLTIDPKEFQPFAPKLRVNNDDLIEHLPDIHPWVPFMIVSERAKIVIEEFAPNSAYFFPVEIFSQTSKPIEKPFYWCVVKNRLYYRNSTLGRSIVSVPFPGYFSDGGLVYEIETYPEIQNHLDALPLWGLGLRLGTACFSQSLFKHLKSELLTGLVENTETKFASDRKPYESIGHIA
jgi:hypothetical protein